MNKDNLDDFDSQQQNNNVRRRFLSFNHVSMIGVVEQVKVYMTQNNERLLKLNLKVPVDFNDPTKGPYNWFYASCFGFTKSIKIGDWILIQNGRLGKYKSVRDGITKYNHQITCGENNVLNLNDLVQQEVPINRGEDINDILDDVRSKFLDSEAEE